MSQKRENSEILKLKFLKQDYLSAKKEQVDGDAEIKKALAKFRSKVDLSETESFDSIFYGKNSEATPQSSDQNLDIAVADERQNLESSTDTKAVKPTWAKKLYKSVVSRTHPDKYVNFPVESIKKKYEEVYIDAVDAWKTNDWKSLLVCGYEVDITVDDLNAKELIQKGIEEYVDQIQQVRKAIGYHWYHLKEQERYTILENYLKQLGFTFTKDRIVEVVNSLRRESLNRKTGQRPIKNIGVKRLK